MRDGRTRRFAAAVLAVAAIGGITAAVAEAMSMNTHRDAKSASTVVGAKHNGALGQILDAGSKHLTVYMFAGDHGKKSSCNSKCVVYWPPVTTKGKPKASGAAHAADLGTISRSGGVKQVTYKGHPLYFYAGDKAASAANGQDVVGFGAAWHVLSPAGQAITKKAGAPPSTGTTPTNTGTGTGTGTTPTQTQTQTGTTTTSTTTTSTGGGGWS